MSSRSLKIDKILKFENNLIVVHDKQKYCNKRWKGIDLLI